MNINTLPTDIQNIICDYVKQIEVHYKKKMVIAELKSMIRYDIKICKNCRDVATVYDCDENYSMFCNHDYYLSKSFYLTEQNRKIIKSDVFNFYCKICDRYEFFFNHLWH